MALFILTAVGLASLYYKTLALPFWFIFAYIVAWELLFVFAFDSLIAGGKLSKKKFLLLVSIVMVISAAVTHSTWVIVTPRWVFSVTTDKSTYELGENMQITVTLQNLGFIAHSFRSSLSDPVWISVEYKRPGTIPTQVWYSHYHENITEFSIKPKESLERTFVWNQTHEVNLGIWNGEEIKPGTYRVVARIPKDECYNLFFARTSINITQNG